MEHPEPRIRWLGGQRRRTGRHARPARRGRSLPAGGFNRTDLHAVRRRTGALEPVGGPSGVPGVDCAIQAFDGLAVRSHHGAWGAFRQRERPDEARLPDARSSRSAAKGTVPPCGGFNAVPGEPAIRLLSGPAEAPTFLDGGAGHGRHAGPGRPVSARFARHIGGGGRGGRRSARSCVTDGGDAGPGRIAHIGRETVGQVFYPFFDLHPPAVADTEKPRPVNGDGPGFFRSPIGLSRHRKRSTHGPCRSPHGPWVSVVFADSYLPGSPMRKGAQS